MARYFFSTARFLFIYFMQRQCFVYFFATASFCYYFFCNNKVDFEEFLRLVRQRSENLDEEVFKHLCLQAVLSLSVFRVVMIDIKRHSPLYIIKRGHLASWLGGKLGLGSLCHLLELLCPIQKPEKNPSLEMFKRFDADSSGSLSPEEWMAVRRRSCNCFVFLRLLFLFGFQTLECCVQ